jgi:TRAP-type transport system small permease protein
VGRFELTEMLLAMLIFAGLPLVSLHDEHVTVDLFDSVTPDWLLGIQHVIACAVGALCTSYIAWRLCLRAGNLIDVGETTALLKIQLGWLAYAMSMLMALTAVAFGIRAARGRQRRTGSCFWRAWNRR